MTRIETMPRSLQLLVFAIILIVGIVFLADAYKSDSITLSVRNASNGRPVPDVVVSADWAITAGHGVKTSELIVLEVVTNTDGIAVLPGWGPVIDLSRGHLSNRQPTIRLLKQGFIPELINGLGITEGISGRAFYRLTDGPVELSLAIHPFDGSPAEYERQLIGLMGSLRHVVMGSDCAWTKMPLIINRISAIKSELMKHGSGHRLVDISSLGNQDNCGDAAEIIGGMTP